MPDQVRYALRSRHTLLDPGYFPAYTNNMKLHGDVKASVEKAESLLAFARKELDDVKTDTVAKDRARLRQAANKAWIALSAGADAYLCATKGRTAKSRRDTINVYKALGSEAAGNAGTVYGNMHIHCGYADDTTACTRATAEVGFRLAGQAISILKRHLHTLHAQGKARKVCPAYEPPTDRSATKTQLRNPR